LLVFHDNDGHSQFHASTERQPDEIVVVHVAHLVDSDPALHEVADLPVGWKAWRDDAKGPWHREPTPEDQGEI
jgi:hypothetical protein